MRKKGRKRRREEEVCVFACVKGGCSPSKLSLMAEQWRTKKCKNERSCRHAEFNVLHIFSFETHLRASQIVCSEACQTPGKLTLTPSTSEHPSTSTYICPSALSHSPPSTELISYNHSPACKTEKHTKSKNLQLTQPSPLLLSTLFLTQLQLQLERPNCCCCCSCSPDHAHRPVM